MSTSEHPSWLVYDEDLVAGQTSTWLPEETIPSYKFYGGEIEVFFDKVPHIYFKYNADGEREDIAGVTTVIGKTLNKEYLKPWVAKVTIGKMKELMMTPDGRIRSFSTEELLSWFEEAKKEHTNVLHNAGNIGTLAHDAIEVSIKHAIANTNGVVRESPIVVLKEFDNFTPEQVQKAQSCATAAYDWMTAHSVVWMNTEKKVYSREYDFSGTLDGDAFVSSCSNPICKGCRGRVFTSRRAITDWKTSNQLSNDYALQTAAYVLAHLEEYEDLVIQDRWIMRLGKEDGKFECWYLPAETFEDDITAFLNVLATYRSMDKIEKRTSAENRKFTAFKKSIKEAAEELEKKQKSEARAALKAAKEDWDQKRKTFYKALRGQKVPKADAELQTETAFPKANRPGAKEESEPVQADSAVPTQANIAEPLPVATAPVSTPVVPKGQWKWKP
jgi:hypothetical protein